MATFEQFNLPKSLQKAIDELGFVQPTPIQEKSFNVILSGKDIMGIAQTGTGKTFAYLLPILKQWKFQETDAPRVVILVPTRELVVQVVEEVEKLTKYMSIRVLGIYGGVNINTQKKSVYDGVDIVVATPGRLMDLALDNVLRFDNLQKLVIDEFDEILNLGFRIQLTAILSMMKERKQNILFSATMTEEVDEILEDYFNFPKEISLAPSGTPLEKIEQSAYAVPNFLTKLNILKEILNTDETATRVLLFVNNKRLADYVLEHLEEEFPNEFGVIHSNKTQNYRLNTMELFQNGELRGLVTTDVMARGLDITDITHVFNMQLPEIPEQYIHRIGRTGRADKDGKAISFISPKEEEEAQLEIEELMNYEIPMLAIPETVKIEEQKLEFEKDRVKLATNKRKIDAERGEAFHEKKEKNKKVNLGGPGKRTPRKSAPRNRAVERKRNEKRKKK
ncbi:DEAD/DEAH box helicase [Flavobacterium sp. xlx-214]|uniref:DEAD/DEAH box helicase n=1 Tax=unclassified Flavobacterium TaxID=196869 RepID=UPI0013D75E59|nr:MULTISPECIES: DEAD/DEAH box helicase [unclassified Flavobacterium]MBA5793218.1 DEAD/DEAH box helicase [Flavobacterium sp. xlx-221]QMI82499.1 DEAD/DEAH box helicase [Flavobacterium sp. xlx-214]